jgi:iron-sulfur cluster repair protein YtfE (RIC family)
LNDNQSTDEQRRKLTTRIAQEEQRISELNTELEQRRALVQRLKDGTDRVQAPDDAAFSMA